MRVKRTAILASLLVSMVASVWFGSSALSGDGSGDDVFAGRQAGDGLGSPGAPNEASNGADVETRSGSVSHYFVWAGAFISMLVFLVATVLFRTEVSREKRAGRARAQRRQYYRDLRRYKEQLQGPPRDNT